MSIFWTNNIVLIIVAGDDSSVKDEMITLTVWMITINIVYCVDDNVKNGMKYENDDGKALNFLIYFSLYY